MKESVRSASLFPTHFSSSLTVGKSGSWRSWRKNPQGISSLLLYVAQNDLTVWKYPLPLEEPGFHLQSCGKEFWSTLRKQLGHLTGGLLCRENLKSINMCIRRVYLHYSRQNVVLSPLRQFDHPAILAFSQKVLAMRVFTVQLTQQGVTVSKPGNNSH